MAAKRLSHIVMSTDDVEIANAGRSLGIDVPFLRPSELAQDDSPMFPVVRHAVEALETMNMKFDAVCLLQPTNPLRTAADIDRCIEILDESGADSVISVLRVPDTYNPKWVYWANENGSLRLSSGDDEPISRRQDLPKAFHREGSVYVTRRDVIFDYGNLYGKDIRAYEIDAERYVNIDTPEDWETASAKIKGRTNPFRSEYAKIF
jgi:CMP-N-acetylneuraminic acid synthetase